MPGSQDGLTTVRNPSHRVMIVGFFKELSMSRPAAMFLLIALVSGLYGLSEPAAAHKEALWVCSGVASGLLLIALFIGRRIKFDPILRRH